ncbi:MAG: hypothetical protein ACLU94_11880 [Catenibacillus sp.]
MDKINMDLEDEMSMLNKKGGRTMHEKIYGTMKNVGVGNLVFGIIIIVAGITVGVMSIINGAKLLKSKSNILF